MNDSRKLTLFGLQARDFSAFSMRAISKMGVGAPIDRVVLSDGGAL